jgi:hypothetical protein|tara:strand:+ start:589 stop:1206 length:618 start_codon:yes stop_codon:yes gene_type:complete
MLSADIHPKELELIFSYLDKDKVMLEYGCGGSTTIFPPYVKKYYSIEHNLDWFWAVQQELYNDKIDNVEIHLCDIPKGLPTKREEFWDKYDENLLYAQEHLNTNITQLTDCVYPRDRYVWSEYIDYVDKIGVDHFDVVFIDGRARTDCAYKILNYIDESSIVFIHDFWPRPEYHKVFDYYTEVVSIKDTQIGDGGQTIVGLKKNG